MGTIFTSDNLYIQRHAKLQILRAQHRIDLACQKADLPEYGSVAALDKLIAEIEKDKHIIEALKGKDWNARVGNKFAPHAYDLWFYDSAGAALCRTYYLDF